MAALTLSLLLPVTGPAYARQEGAAPAPGPAVRTDGVYELALPAAEGETARRRVALRLYDDHTAAETDRTSERAGDPPDRNDAGLLPGVWTLEGDQLTVVVSDAFSEKTRTGTLTSAGWVINERVMFAFRKVAFPRETGTNRRPRFKGRGTAVLNFDYDAAGNMSGARHELSTQAEDPDGDSLTFKWQASNGTIVGEGPSVVWQRVLEAGRPVPGTVTVTVTDGKGGWIVSATPIH